MVNSPPGTPGPMTGTPGGPMTGPPGGPTLGTGPPGGVGGVGAGVMADVR